MTKKIRIFSKDQLNPSGIDSSLEIIQNEQEKNFDFQWLENKDDTSLNADYFSGHKKAVVYQNLENDPKFIAAHRLHHFIPHEVNKLPKKTIAELYPKKKEVKLHQRFNIFNMSDRGEAIESILDLVSEGQFLSFKGNFHLVLDEVITNALHAQHSPIPPVRADFFETEDEYFLRVRDHGGKLTEEDIFQYLSRGTSDLFCEPKKRGSGLGIVFTYYHSTTLVFNIKENKSTDVLVGFKKLKRDKIYYQTPKEFHLFYEKEFNVGEREFSVETTEENGCVTFSFKGAINEDFTFDNLLGHESEKYKFNLEEVSLLNSCGIREWIKFINQLPSASTLEYHNCPTVMVLQMNMVKGFLTDNAKVISFYAPYYDESKDEEIKVLLTADQVQNNQAPEIKNDDGEELEFDGIEATYFKFLS